MMRREKGEYRIGMGASTMLMIFVSLSLATLSILALMSARADAALQTRNLHMTVAYYQAADLAQRALAQIDQQVLAAQAEAQSEEEYRQALVQIAADGVEFELKTADSCRFIVDAGENRRLSVSVELIGYGQTGPRCRVVRHVLQGAPLWPEEAGAEGFEDALEALP